MMIHMLDDPWAEHPVVNRRICHGGGGGSSYQVGQTPTVPDYSQYISAMTGVGNTLTGYGKDLYDWAKNAGVQVSQTADTVSKRAGDLADTAGQQYKDMMAKWKQTYEPLYDAQAADAQRMIGNLPQTEEQYAGKYAADVAQAFDASKAASDRQLRSYGLKAPSSGAAQLDTLASNQRRLGQVAAAEQGRLSARTEARGVAQQAIQSGLAFPQVANQASATELAAGNQQIGAPESAISTATGAYSPALSAYGVAYPYMQQWGQTMGTSYNQQLAGYNAQQQALQQKAKLDAESGGSGIGGILGGIAGTAAGSIMGPAGASIGSSLGSKIGGMFAKGGMIEDANFVHPDASPSNGAITDDVPARLNAGEFVLPKDVVAWMGEERLQKLIQTARGKREKNTIAEPDMAPAGAIDMQAPTFRSEGARVP
jgi:hypothetical protein